MARLKIEPFGEYRVRRGEDPIERREWDGQKSRSLFKLLTRPGRAFSGDEIVEALWPGVSPEVAKRRLRVTVSSRRRTLELVLERSSGVGPRGAPRPWRWRSRVLSGGPAGPSVDPSVSKLKIFRLKDRP